MAWKFSMWSLWMIFAALWLAVPVKYGVYSANVDSSVQSRQSRLELWSNKIINAAEKDYGFIFIGKNEYWINEGEVLYFVEFNHEFTKLRYVHSYYFSYLERDSSNDNEASIYTEFLNKSAFLVNILNNPQAAYNRSDPRRSLTTIPGDIMDLGYLNVARLYIMKLAGLLELETIGSKLVTSYAVSVSEPHSTVIGVDMILGMNKLEHVMDSIINNSNRFTTPSTCTVNPMFDKLARANTSNKSYITEYIGDTYIHRLISYDKHYSSITPHSISGLAALESIVRASHPNLILSSILDNTLNINNDLLGNNYLRKFSSICGNVCHGVYGSAEAITNGGPSSTAYRDLFQKLHSPENMTLYIFSEHPISRFLEEGCAETRKDSLNGGLFCKSLLNKPDTNGNDLDTKNENNFVAYSENIRHYGGYRGYSNNNDEFIYRPDAIQLTAYDVILHDVSNRASESLGRVTYPTILFTFLLPEIYEYTSGLGASLVCDAINTIMLDNDVMSSFSRIVRDNLNKRHIEYEVIPQVTRVICSSTIPYLVVGLNRISSGNSYKHTSEQAIMVIRDPLNMKAAIAEALMGDENSYSDKPDFYNSVKDSLSEESCKNAIEASERMVLRHYVDEFLSVKNVTSPLNLLYVIAGYESNGTLIDHITGEEVSEMVGIFKEKICKNDGLAEYLKMIGRGVDYDNVDINIGPIFSIDGHLSLCERIYTDNSMSLLRKLHEDGHVKIIGDA